MSGGTFDYKNNDLASDIFGYGCYPSYGLDSEDVLKSSKNALIDNPLEDIEISGIVHDVFCLLDSYDYYKEGDTSESQYRKDVEFFKNKWLNRSSIEISKEIVDAYVDKLKSELYKILGVKADDSSK